MLPPKAARVCVSLRLIVYRMQSKYYTDSSFPGTLYRFNRRGDFPAKSPKASLSAATEASVERALAGPDSRVSR